MNDKTSEAQKRASREWKKRNPARTKYMSYKSSAKTFIRHHATETDIKELENLINERKEKLKRGE